MKYKNLGGKDHCKVQERREELRSGKSAYCTKTEHVILLFNI